MIETVKTWGRRDKDKRLTASTLARHRSHYIHIYIYINKQRGAEDDRKRGRVTGRDVDRGRNEEKKQKASMFLDRHGHSRTGVDVSKEMYDERTLYWF